MFMSFSSICEKAFYCERICVAVSLAKFYGQKTPLSIVNNDVRSTAHKESLSNRAAFAVLTNKNLGDQAGNAAKYVWRNSFVFKQNFSGFLLK